MILVINLKSLVSFFFSKKGLDILLDNEAFHSTQRTFQQSKKNCSFPRGQPIILVAKLKSLVSFFFSKKRDPYILLDNVLERKQGFLEYTKDILT